MADAVAADDNMRPDSSCLPHLERNDDEWGLRFLSSMRAWICKALYLTESVPNSS